jgi:4-hydroxythreonine-4-phosphate dehydrogenase
VIQQLQQEDMDISGPYSADTLFMDSETCDVFITMYHDQGLPVLKYASFGEAVNVTCGLPFIRTSVDHGTALELAGTGRAEAGSLLAALAMAADMTRYRERI